MTPGTAIGTVGAYAAAVVALLIVIAAGLMLCAAFVWVAVQVVEATF